MASGPWRVIESPQNPSFKLWESLTEGRGIRKAGQFLLAGRKNVPEALARWPDRFTAVLATDEGAAEALGLPNAFPRVALPKVLFDRLDVSGTGFPLLVGTEPEMPVADLAARPEGLELVCALGDPSNLGALLRSAAAFGASRVMLLEEAAHPFHPRCLRGAANAVFSLRLLRAGRWSDLKRAAGPLLALDAGGEDLSRFDWPADCRLILGEEGQGVPADLPARRLTVPTTGAVESLNATVAASLALYQRFAHRR